MSEVTKAKFNFLKFEIDSFSYRKPTNSNNQLSVDIHPSGKFFALKSEYVMTMDFTAHEIIDPKKNPKDAPLVSNVKLVATFLFNDVHSMEDIPSFFYKNGLAIAFPYLRSFISNMTLQANLELLVLPLYNLSALEKTLIQQTEYIKD